MMKEMGSGSRRLGLKRNINEMKLYDKSTFMSMNKDKDTSLVESLVRRFEAMLSVDILGDMKELDMKNVRFENTYKSPGKRRRLCGDKRPRRSPERPSRSQARQISATLLGGEAAAGRRGQVQEHGIGQWPCTNQTQLHVLQHQQVGLVPKQGGDGGHIHQALARVVLRNLPNILVTLS